MDIGFAEALLLLGLLLVIAAALSGWLHGTVLSISVLSVVAGVALALTGIVEADPGAELIVLLVELALILTLFSDGLFVEGELLRAHWGPPARALVVAMPLTLVFLALCGKALFPELTWAEAFLLGAVLSPTDPVVTSAVVTAERVPRVIRHTLNLESGLNDGLALPFVLFFLVLATAGDAVREGLNLAGEAIVGAVLGVGLALLAGRALQRLPGGAMMHKYEGIYALGLGFIAFGLADFTYGNGLIAAFVAGIALASGAPDRTLVFDVASFVILASILAHGLTDTVGARWIERRLGSVGAQEDGVREHVETA